MQLVEAYQQSWRMMQATRRMRGDTGDVQMTSPGTSTTPPTFEATVPEKTVGQLASYNVTPEGNEMTFTPSGWQEFSKRVMWAFGGALVVGGGVGYLVGRSRRRR
jgi:hypothetical protein